MVQVKPAMTPRLLAGAAMTDGIKYAFKPWAYSPLNPANEFTRALDLEADLFHDLTLGICEQFPTVTANHVRGELVAQLRWNEWQYVEPETVLHIVISQETGLLREVFDKMPAEFLYGLLNGYHTLLNSCDPASRTKM